MRKPLLAALAAATLIAGAGGAWLWRAPDRAATTPDDQSNDPAERAALEASRGLAWRRGASLNFRLQTGETITLTDRRVCGDLPCPKEIQTSYRYLGWSQKAGGYRLQALPATSEVILLYPEEEAVLIEARQAEELLGSPMALPDPPPPVREDDAIAGWLRGVADSRDKAEAPSIAASGGQAARRGAVLAIRLSDGRTMAISDDLICGQLACPPQIFRSFQYAGQSPGGRYHVLAERWDEASSAYLLDAASGAITAMPGVPQFAPDGRRAVAAITELEWSAPRRLEIWSLSGAAPSLEFALEATPDEDTVYDVIGWRDPEHIRLRRGPWGSKERETVTLARRADKWQLERGE